MATVWVDKDMYVTRGPYDGDHYDIRAPGVNNVRVHREQLKLAVGGSPGTAKTIRALVTLKEFKNSFE
ncbi:hypothetical protein SARC_06366 [Sphaeroforma arctica JP610]|uniref:Uncharacterized protein n=1 Tax=Sphaeroforma arctica JP610 TaxID=667725 RepID=A0A0L0FXK8_9EUKA|nr:hypothetical protein SARC_06366 [Sphaeroforma arctica JP610]KNC81296.1 hypothetical protein SARC_06366 [Sphaeroforma arctica JP610]|eukprot:XP_014155198.1 hypothetical protein SARC_06366 [Sphaeroforma arctica JP610]